ncbi:MAG: stage II sporulation protein M [Arenimonas sp.]
MKQEDFVAQYNAEWVLFERWLNTRSDISAKKRKPLASNDISDYDFPVRYRRLCQHLSIAQQRGYSPLITDKLEELMQRGHHVLYRPPAPRLRRLIDFFLMEFPCILRKNHGYFWTSAFLFYAPLISMIVLIHFYPELVHSLLSDQQISEMEKMYDPANAADSLGRTSGTNLQMFGFYIWNNVSIGFRTFASGFFVGIGSILVLLFNGISIGAVAGHLTVIGSGHPFWRFVVGHSGPELTAIVISGAAGLRIGMAIVAPGRKKRVDALIEAGTEGVKLAMGIFAMLVFAAFIEAYWSSIVWMPDVVKYSVGGMIWLLIIAWLWRGGRGSSYAT